MLKSLRFSRNLNVISPTKEFFKVYEVGPRDGLQNEKTFLPTTQKVEFVNRLSATGLKAIEAASFASPTWIPQLKDGEEVLKRIDRFPNVSYSAVVVNKVGLTHATTDRNLNEIAIFHSCSETFSRKNVNCSKEENLKRMKDVVDAAVGKVQRVRAYLSVVVGCPYDGETDPKTVARAAEALLELGCYRIALSDTIGVGSASSVSRMLNEVLAVAPPEKFAVHFHDSYGQALTNVLVSIDKGIRAADGSVGGLGGCPFARGSTGNLATEDLVYMVHDLGFETGIDLDKLAQTGDWICSVLNRPNASKCSTALSVNRCK